MRWLISKTKEKLSQDEEIMPPNTVQHPWGTGRTIEKSHETYRGTYPDGEITEPEKIYPSKSSKPAERHTGDSPVNLIYEKYLGKAGTDWPTYNKVSTTDEPKYTSSGLNNKWLKSNK